jgi:hypothetical protein
MYPILKFLFYIWTLNINFFLPNRRHTRVRRGWYEYKDMH